MTRFHAIWMPTLLYVPAACYYPWYEDIRPVSRSEGTSGGEMVWYLDFYVPRMNPDGIAVLKDGRRVLRRLRPRYKTRELAQADVPNIRSQHAAAGVSHSGILTRAQALEYDQAKLIVPEASLVEKNHSSASLQVITLNGQSGEWTLEGIA